MPLIYATIFLYKPIPFAIKTKICIQNKIKESDFIFLPYIYEENIWNFYHNMIAIYLII